MSVPWKVYSKETIFIAIPEGAHDTSSGPCKESIARHHVALCLYRPDQVVESDTHLATQELRQVSYREYHNHSAFQLHLLQLSQMIPTKPDQVPG